MLLIVSWFVTLLSLQVLCWVLESLPKKMKYNNCSGSKVLVGGKIVVLSRGRRLLSFVWNKNSMTATQKPHTHIYNFTPSQGWIGPGPFVLFFFKAGQNIYICVYEFSYFFSDATVSTFSSGCSLGSCLLDVSFFPLFCC